MSRVTFNRKRVKLKQLLGIRARLALLALILVAPLMLERARSLEDDPRQADRAGLQGILQSRAAQRRCPARGHLLGRDDAEIGRLYPRIGRRRRPQLRHPARQPAGQSALDPQPVDRRRRWTGAVLDQRQSSSASISATVPISRRRARPATSSSATICSPGSPTTPIVMAAYPVSAINRDDGCRHPCRRQSRLDVEDHEQSRRPARHFSAC